MEILKLQSTVTEVKIFYYSKKQTGERISELEDKNTDYTI
jgi:hypothetical protein